jgi:hypothetical protein
MKMTKKEREILTYLRDKDETMEVVKGEVWYGLNRTNFHMLYKLLAKMWIALEQTFAYDPEYETYLITESGKRALAEAEKS